jgi:hypothetical protein
MAPQSNLTDEEIGAIRHYLDTHPQNTYDHVMDEADEMIGKSCLIGIALVVLVIIVIAVLSNDAVWSFRD